MSSGKQVIFCRNFIFCLHFLSEPLDKTVVQGLGSDEVDDLHGSVQDFLQNCWQGL
jgi:hypothetical protein